MLSTQGIELIITKCCSYSESERINCIIDLCNQAENLNEDNLKQDINTSFFICLSKYIDKCLNEHQLALFNLTEILTERGAQISNKEDYNYLYQAMCNSGLLSKIESNLQIIIHTKEKGTETEQKFDLQLSILSIFFFVMKNNNIENKTLEQCAYVLQESIQVLIELIQSFKTNFEQREEKEQKKTKIQNLMKKIARLLNSLKYITWNSQIYLIKLKLYELVAFLVHINCNNSLLCTQRLIIPDSNESNNLQIGVFQNLLQFSKDNSDVQNFLIKQHNIMEHIICKFIDFADSQTSQHLSIIQTSSRTSSSGLNHSLVNINYLPFQFYQFLIRNNLQLVEKSVSNPRGINALIIISKYNRTKHLNESEDENSAMIRYQSFRSLATLLYHGQDEIRQQLVNSRYMNALIETTSTSGGCEENDAIRAALFTIRNFQYVLLGQWGQSNYTEQQNLITCNEQIEFEGGMEEINANYFRSDESGYYSVKYNAQEAMNKIINRFKSQTMEINFLTMENEEINLIDEDYFIE